MGISSLFQFQHGTIKGKPAEGRA